MRKPFQYIVITVCCIVLMITMLAPAMAYAQTGLNFTQEEEAFILRTQNGEPLKTGIIPHSFPLSACPPEYDDYMGIYVAILDLITQKTGIKFEFSRIPTEQMTPYQSLKAGNSTLVAGTIKTEKFMADPELLLSDRLFDSSAVYIGLRGFNPLEPKTGKIAVMSGYQAGMEDANKQFPQYEVLSTTSNIGALSAVASGDADMAIVIKYVTTYDLQKPFFENLVAITPYVVPSPSCIMGLNTPENQVAISIINKGLAAMTEDEYTYALMNFTISNPYKLTFADLLYKYRLVLVSAAVFSCLLAFVIIQLIATQRERAQLLVDNLTGALTEVGFEVTAKKVLAKSDATLFITDFDICRFGGYNEFHGRENGDMLLKEIVKVVRLFLCEKDLICRTHADHFKVMSINHSLEAHLKDIRKGNEMLKNLAKTPLIFSFGIYEITDKALPISKMFDYAAIAKRTVKGNEDNFIGVFDDGMYQRMTEDAQMMAAFDNALKNDEFIPCYQPKYDTQNQQIVGAEALVRWVHADGTVVPPLRFIELFEKSGQIQKLDFHMLKRVCMLQKTLIEQGIAPLPISVNFSRINFYNENFVSKIRDMVNQYRLPKHVIEIECTETVITTDPEDIKHIFHHLRDEGFVIALDDFGSGYSSLNVLSEFPLDVIKLDRGFILSTEGNEKSKAMMVIKNVIKLAGDLSLKVVAEGVETKEQYLFLKKMGCDYIQGYFFSKPVDEQRYLELLEASAQKTEGALYACFK